MSLVVLVFSVPMRLCRYFHFSAAYEIVLVLSAAYEIVLVLSAAYEIVLLFSPAYETVLFFQLPMRLC